MTNNLSVISLRYCANDSHSVNRILFLLIPGIIENIRFNTWPVTHILLLPYIGLWPLLKNTVLFPNYFNRVVKFVVKTSIAGYCCIS